MSRHLSLFLSLVLIAGMTFVGTGCELRMPWDPPPKPADESAANDQNAGDEGGGDAELPKLDMKLLLPPAMRNLPVADVRIPMSDGMQIAGKLYDPSLKADEDGEVVAPEAGDNGYQGPRYPLVILLHGLNRDQSTWQDLPATLLKAGYAVFAMDLRGHGQSIRTTRGRRVDWRLLSADQWSHVGRDVAQTLDYFKKCEDYPEVNAADTALVGERLGANVAARAAKLQDQIKGLVLISPDPEIKGYNSSQDLIEYPHGVLIMVSEDEREAYNTSRLLYNLLSGPKTLQIYRKAGQGSDMLVSKPAIGEQIRDWLLQVLPPTGAAGTAPASTNDAAKDGQATGTEEKAPPPAASSSG